MYVHTARKIPDRKKIDDFDGQGADLLTLLRGFINTLDAAELVDNDTERYVSISELEPSGRTLFCEVEAGIFGTEGKIKNVQTHALEHEHGPTSATTRTMRFVAVAPKGAVGMLVFVEHVGGSNAARRILALFYRALRHKYSDLNLTFKVDNLVEQDAWLQRAELEKVTGFVNSYQYSADVADAGQAKLIGQLEVGLVPVGKKKFLPKRVWSGLKDRDIEAAKVLGLSADLDVDEVHVTVSADGRSKTFAIDREREPSISYLFAERGYPDTTAFLNFSFERAKDLLPSVGAEWKADIKDGAWGSEEFDVKLDLPSE